MKTVNFKIIKEYRKKNISKSNTDRKKKMIEKIITIRLGKKY